MAFTLPNEASAFVAAQAEPDKVDFDILAAGSAGTGVVSGCAVTAQGTPDMTVAVASGVAIVAGTPVVVAAGNVVITAADATNPRFDLIVVDNAGAKSAVAGTPAAGAVFPAIPASSVVLAAVYVPAVAAEIAAAQIVDKRVIFRAVTSVSVTTANGVSGSVANPTTTPAISLTLGANSLTGASGLPVSSGISGLGTNVATFLATPSSANLAAALTTKTGTGNAVFSDSPVFTTKITTPSVATTAASMNIESAGVWGPIKLDVGNGGLGLKITGTSVSGGNAQLTFYDTIRSASLGIVNGVFTFPSTVSFTNVGGGPSITTTSPNLWAVDHYNAYSGTYPGPYTTLVAKITNAGDAYFAGTISIGTTATTIGNANKLQVAGTTAATNSLGISAWSADALGARIELGKSRGAAIGTNTIVNSGDVVGSVTGYGANGSTFTNAAQISMEIDGTPGATNDMPGRIVFKTTPDGSGTLTEALRIDSAQATTFAARANLKSYTVGTLPAAGIAGGAIYVSDAGGNGPCIALSDGTNWKRCDNTSTTVV